MRRTLLIIGLLAFVPQVVSAEIVVLKDGRVLEGKTVGKTDEFVTIEVDGVNQTFKIDEISYMGAQFKSAPVTETDTTAAPAPTNELPQEPEAPNDQPAKEEMPQPTVEGTIVEEAPLEVQQPEAANPIVEDKTQAAEPAVDVAPDASDTPSEAIDKSAEAAAQEQMIEKISDAPVQDSTTEEQLKPVPVNVTDEAPAIEANEPVVEAPEAALVPEGSLTTEEPSSDTPTEMITTEGTTDSSTLMDEPAAGSGSNPK